MSHTISHKGIELIHSFESFRSNAYQNPGDRPTIGWGNTFYLDGTPVKLGERITRVEADLLFLKTIELFERGVNSLVKSQINQDRFDALVSFAYNLGIKSLKNSTLLKKVNLNPNDPTIKGEFVKWVSKGTIFEKGLTRRRLAESKLYFG